MAQASLTARRTCRADGKPEHSELLLYALDADNNQRIKATLGITG